MTSFQPRTICPVEICTAVRCLTPDLMRSSQPTPRNNFSSPASKCGGVRWLPVVFCDNWLILQGNRIGEKSFWTRFCSLDAGAAVMLFYWCVGQEESLSRHSCLKAFCLEPVLMEDYVF